MVERPISRAEYCKLLYIIVAVEMFSIAARLGLAPMIVIISTTTQVQVQARVSFHLYSNTPDSSAHSLVVVLVRGSTSIYASTQFESVVLVTSYFKCLM